MSESHEGQDIKNAKFNRRAFCTAGAMSAIAIVTSETHLNAQATPPLSAKPALTTGNGAWTYEFIPGWGTLPEGLQFGGTHGAITGDNAGNIYVSTQSDTGVLVYDPSGKLVRRIAQAYPEVHSLVHAEEAGQEVFYAVVQKGTPKENWLFLKMKTDGTTLQKITAPPEAGFKTPNEWRITAAVPAPDGSIYIANGYGDSRIFKFDSRGNYKSSFAGKGKTDGLCDCSHGLAIDTRYDQPLLIVCDRENLRVSHFDLDGKFVAHLSQHMRRPCQISFHGEYAIVSELQGRVTVLDHDNVPVAFIGDNPQKEQWAKYRLELKDIPTSFFSAAHGCFIDSQANIYISDWNKTGRVSKLKRVSA